MVDIRKPIWLTSKKLGGRKTRDITKYLRQYKLHTVCESAKCPNRGECFDRGIATFMILGETCTRNCTFCAVDKDKNNLFAPDPDEPSAIARLAKKIGLNHVVITTVTRDDLNDGGASQFMKVIWEIRKKCDKEVSIEVLISDFKGDLKQVERIVQTAPDILNHNIETIKRLYPSVRPMADFKRSLQVLQKARKTDKNILTKSGFMVGLGETKEEVISLMNELRDVDVDILTIGQYIAPSRNHYQVKEYIHPDVFSYYKNEGELLGFKIVESAPLVRSSYHAEKARIFLKKGEDYANYNNRSSL